MIYYEDNQDGEYSTSELAQALTQEELWDNVDFIDRIDKKNQTVLRFSDNSEIPDVNFRKISDLEKQLFLDLKKSGDLVDFMVNQVRIGLEDENEVLEDENALINQFPDVMSWEQMEAAINNAICC